MKQRINFPLLYLAYLSALLYFCIWRFNWLILGLFIISCALALFRKYFLIFPILLLIFGFIFWQQQNEQQMSKSLPDNIHEIVPYIDTLEVNGDSLTFRGKSGNRDYQVYYKLKSEQEKAFFSQLNQDVLLQVDGELGLPAVQRNFNGFDYQSYLKTQNIYQLLSISNIKNIRTIHTFDLRLFRRQAILWTQNHFPRPMSSYMTGLLFGYLGKDFEQMGDIYTSLGIIHLFALSGMQVNFFIEGLRKFLLRIGLSRENVDKFQIPFSIFYAFMTGLSISVIRALLQKNIKLQASDNFSASFFALLLLFPKFLLTTGGQLSMMYAFLLMMLTGLFKNLTGIKKILLESTVLSLGVLPLLILNFHVFQPFSILLTFMFSVIFDLFLLPALLFVFLFSVLFHLSFNLNFIFLLLEKLIQFTDKIFHFPLVLGTPTVPILLGLFITTGLFIDTFRKKRRLTVIFALMIFILFFFAKNPVNPSITMVDIGQGDSIFLQDSLNRKTILIDTGGKVSFGGQQDWQKKIADANADSTLIPYLRSLGVGKIDVMLLTHTDNDHVGDMLDVADKIKVKELWISQGSLENEDFANKVRKSKLFVHVAKKGDKIPIFNGQLQVLSGGYTGKGDNNDSLVTYGNFYGLSFLFTGDLERPGEKKLLEDYPQLKVDVLKVGHHGSKTASSPDFIEKSQVKLGLISCGLNNRYKHPNEETLQTLNKYHVKIYRTDQEGAIKLTENAGQWEIKTVKMSKK